ncbi:hypothetical protein AAF712_008151 [Marasmius tenuissimus]|uniref:Uncharacterized protein n=1 Tax=Marasmius tenuissimus TaxID=585030 RepID=A0ABR2ZU21_9AGAR
MRLKDDLDNQEKLQNRVAGPTYSHLVKALRTTINAKPELKAHKLLGPFFNRAVQAMLPDHLPCASSEPELPLLVACRYLDDPVKTFHEWLTQEQDKVPERRRDIIRTARNFAAIFRTQDMPQDRLDKRISTLMPFVEERVKHLGAESLSDAQTRQSVLDAIELCIVIRASTSQLSGLLSNKVYEERKELRQISQLSSGAITSRWLISPTLRFAAGAIKQMITLVLKNSQISSQVLEKPGCGCSSLCMKHLVPVFAGDSYGEKQFRISVSESETIHLVEHLARMRSWGVTWAVTKAEGRIC